MNRNYDVILFDADGTLFDYDRAESHALIAAFADYNLHCGAPILTAYRAINAELWDRFERGLTTKQELRTERFAELFRRFGLPLDAGSFGARYLRHLEAAPFLVEGALPVCRALYAMQKKLFIVTNGISSVQKNRLERSELRPYISGLFISEEIGTAKPHRGYFDYVLEQVRCAPERILLVGDSLSADIAGANFSGLDSCWFCPEETENRSEFIPTYVIRTLEELTAIVENRAEADAAPVLQQG